jgi:hypothetical protein
MRHVGRGRRAIPIRPDVLLALLLSLDGTRPVKVEGLPPDADVELVELDTHSGQIMLVCTSAHWSSGRSLLLPCVELKIK